MKDHKKAIFSSVILALIGVFSAVYFYQFTHTAKLEKQYNLTKEQLNEKASTLEKTKSQFNLTQEEKVKLQQQVEELNKAKTDLEAQLQAKLAEKQRLASLGQQRVSASPVVARTQVSGSCADWLAQAGVSDINSAMILINKESGCNPNAVNPSSGACGVAQELPCGKSGCSLGDGACQVRWMSNYVQQRYGGWTNALNFHYSHNWY